jgi:predicted DNA-binding transcriptional regulator AlpA
MIAAKPAEAEDGAQSELRPMLNEAQVLQLVPISRTTLYRLEKAGKFPKSIHISPNRRCWFLDTIVAWQRAIDELDPHFDPSRGRGKGRRRRVSANPT